MAGLDTANVDLGYTWVNIQGVDCIKWSITPTDASHKVKENRKKLKSKIGHTFMDTPMLDSKSAGSSEEFCDCIVITDKLNRWEVAQYQIFKGMQTKKDGVTGGHQIYLKDQDCIFVTISFYPKPLVHGPAWRTT